MEHQPRHRIPLLPRAEERALELGGIGLSTRLPLWLDTEVGLVVPVEFIVDSGAAMSLMSIEHALDIALSVPPAEAEVNLSIATPQGRSLARVRPGRIRGWWNAECRGHPLDFPILLRADAPAGTPPLLGLGGVIRLCRWTFDGRPTPHEPYGSLTLDDTR